MDISIMRTNFYGGKAIKSGNFQCGGRIQMMTAVVPNKISIGKNGPMLVDGKEGSVYVILPAWFLFYFYSKSGTRLLLPLPRGQNAWNIHRHWKRSVPSRWEDPSIHEKTR
jgi:hypothetical protein